MGDCLKVGGGMSFIDLPIEEAHTIPAEWYRSPDVAKSEFEKVFLKQWQYLMPSSRVAEPGQFAPDKIANLPLVVVRDQKNVLRCFHNVCRHRAGPIAVADGKSRVLQCQYHGWSYTLEGKLAGTPKCDGLKNFDRANCSLPEVSVVEWAGMIFVNAAGDNPATFRGLLQQIAERCGSQFPAAFKYFGRQSFLVQCNWKTYVDNYLEGYHVPMVHPGLARVLDTSRYVTTLHGNYTLQHSPLSSGQSIYESGEAFYFHLFPNMMFNILPGRLQTNIVRAISPGECEVVFDYFYPDVTSDSAKKKIEEDYKFSHEVQMEDMRICAQVQIGLDSGSYHTGRYSPQEEIALHSFHSYMNRILNS